MTDQPHDDRAGGQGQQPPPGFPGPQPPTWQNQHAQPPPWQNQPNQQPDPGAVLPPGWQAPPPSQGAPPGGGPPPAPGMPPAGMPGGVSYAPVPAARENVALGLALSLLSIPIGVVTAVLISSIGFIAAITGLVLSGSALALYAKGAGAAPRRGVLPLIGVILVGVVACVLSIIAWDVSAAYDQYGSAGVSKSSVIAQALVNPVIWKAEAGHVVMFVVFAALGMFGALRRIVAS